MLAGSIGYKVLLCDKAVVLDCKGLPKEGWERDGRGVVARNGDGDSGSR